MPFSRSQTETLFSGNVVRRLDTFRAFWKIVNDIAAVAYMRMMLRSQNDVLNIFSLSCGNLFVFKYAPQPCNCRCYVALALHVAARMMRQKTFSPHRKIRRRKKIVLLVLLQYSLHADIIFSASRCYEDKSEKVSLKCNFQLANEVK